MSSTVLLLVFSLTIIFLGIFGKRFVAGLAWRGRLPIFSGRIWFITVGSSLFLVGVLRLALYSGAGQNKIRVLHGLLGYSGVFLNVLLGFMALVMVIVASLAIASEVTAKTPSRRGVLSLALAALIGGIMFIWSSIAAIISR